jgi:hypothetical protein
MPDTGWRRQFHDPMLVEGYPDLLPLSPDDMTGNVRAVRFNDQVETFGDIQWVSNIERRPEMEMLRTKQFIVQPANSIAPDINTVLRGLARFSMKT